MAAIRFLRASALLLTLACAGVRPVFAGEAPLRDVPAVWEMNDRTDAPKPAMRDPNLLRDGIEETIIHPIGRFFNPSRLVRKVGVPFGGDHVQAASNLNTLDEVPNSSWFTNRIGIQPVTPADAARGPVEGEGPDRSAPWTIVSAKTQGVTPGFNIKDARGQTYLLKFDPPCCPGMSSAAGVITGRILHTAGYNVPEDFVVTFRREDLVLGEKVRFTDPEGVKRPMTTQDLERILSTVVRDPDGSWRAIASKFLHGTPVGPFSWSGRRKDDPLDPVRHENRRELRGLRVIAAWLDHFDMKQGNTLDMYVEEGGRHYVRHYLIDFASTLGAGATGPYPMANYEYAFDGPAIFGRALGVGVYQSPWERIDRPAGLEEVGFLESKEFEPSKWKPLDPNATFANLTDRDGYWAAKIISAFTDEHLQAAVATGRYRNPEAERFVARLLAERRDKIARHWFDRVAPLDFFSVDGEIVRFHDLGHEREMYPGMTPRYRARVAAVDADRGGAEWSGWTEMNEPALDLSVAVVVEPIRSASAEKYPFLAIQTQVSRGEGWSPSVTVYVSRASGRVVALSR